MNLSSPKSYLPMLTGLMLGEAMSCHDGVSCYPALRHSNQEKYILKVISVPASKVQMDAMLLTGAFPTRESALEYYLDISRDVLREAEILRQLSQQEGFIPYLDAQIVDKDSGNGYDVYLLNNFRYSLAQIFEAEVLTHKQIMRMSLDLCAALVACRREGYLYVDLKPANIFFSEEQGYRIGDVGFASLASLPYSSLPEKYRSPYTAPELLDEMAVLNDTVDVYALGLVLYQAYNGGILPAMIPNTPLPAPLYADYAFTDIILKACHYDPAKRWKNPMELAQAIIGYMQAFPVSDASIIPAVPDEPAEPEEPVQVEEFLPEADPEELRREMAALDGTEYEDMAFVSTLGSNSTTDSETTVQADMELSEEVSEMLAKADDLIAHELPEPAVAPAPIEVPMPERIRIEPEIDAETPKEDESTEASKTENNPSAIPAEEPQAAAEEPREPEASDASPVLIPKKPFPWKILAAVLACLALISLFFGGHVFYQNYYLQAIDELILEQKGDMLHVQVVTDVDYALLTVVCSDSYGNTQRQSVVAGFALFHTLDPQTHYSVHLEISGFHKLVGEVSDSFTTAPQTNITQMTAEMGNTDGSVLIRFKTEGPTVDNWVMTYSAAGTQSQPLQQAFQGNYVEIEDLEIGSIYTFILSSADGQAISGNTQIQYTAQSVILAQGLTVTGFSGGSLTAQWKAPENAGDVVWTVKCYNADGYSQTITTSELTATFTGMSHSIPCTVEVLAEGMPQHTSATVPGNAVTVLEFQFSENDDGTLGLSWDYTGSAPDGGWTLEYTIDNQLQPPLALTENSAALLLLPGANYSICVTAVGASMQFGGSGTYTSRNAPWFDQWGVHGENLQGAMCIRPETENWTGQDVDETMYTSTFSKDQLAGLVITTDDMPEAAEEQVTIRFIIRDASGSLIAVEETLSVWAQLWRERACALDIPHLPEETGEYCVDVYFDGKLMGKWTFSVAEKE